MPGSLPSNGLGRAVAREGEASHSKNSVHPSRGGSGRQGIQKYHLFISTELNSGRRVTVGMRAQLVRKCSGGWQYGRPVVFLLRNDVSGASDIHASGGEAIVFSIHPSIPLLVSVVAVAVAVVVIVVVHGFFFW